MPFASLDDVLDHFDHVVALVGVDHVGIGSDYYGVGDSLPTGLKDVSSYPNLVEGLLRRGYSEADVRKIYAEGVLVREETDTERDGRFELVSTYVEGRIVRSETDRDAQALGDAVLLDLGEAGEGGVNAQLEQGHRPGLLGAQAPTPMVAASALHGPMTSSSTSPASVSLLAVRA